MDKKNGNSKRIVIFIIVFGVIIVILGTIFRLKNGYKNGNISNNEITNETLGEFEQIDNKGKKTNTSIKLSENKEFKGLKISNITLTEENGETMLIGEVENISEENMKEFMTIDVKFVDKDGNELGTLTGIIKPLQAGEKTELNSSITTDLANAYDFEISEHSEE